MAEVFVLIFKLLVVVGIQKQQEGSTILQFQGGRTGLLAAQNKQYEYYMRLAQRSLERKHPVAVAFDSAGKVVSELARADSDFVSNVLDQDNERLQILFQGHDGIFFLRRDHPDFRRILRALESSKQANRRIWFVATKPSLLIEDVVLDSEEVAKNGA